MLIKDNTKEVIFSYYFIKKAFISSNNLRSFCVKFTNPPNFSHESAAIPSLTEIFIQKQLLREVFFKIYAMQKPVP